MSDVVNVDSLTFDTVQVNIIGYGEKGDKGDPGEAPSTADLDQAVALTQGYRDEAELWAKAAEVYGKPYASRAAFEAATIPDGITRAAYWSNPLGVLGAKVLTVCLSDTPACAATNGGTKFWQPDGVCHPNHFAENTTPGTSGSPMSAAWQAAIDWATSVVGTGAGVAQRPSAIVRGLPQNYWMGFTVKISGAQDAVKLWGDGARMVSAVAGAVFRVGDDILFSGGDTAGMGSNFQSRITGFTFAVATGNTNNTIAIQAGGCPGLTIDHNVFFDFWVAIDGHRFNGRSICDNFFYINTRTTPALAFIRLQGVYDSTNNHTPGGGIHCERNEFVGPAIDRTMLQDCILIKAVDGFYHASNHFVHYGRAAIAIEPDGTIQNNVIYDVISHGGNYFDDPAALARNVLITGTLTHSGAGGMANGNISNVVFTAKDYFRGGGMASFGILVDVIDGGGFVAARGGIAGFSVTDCTFSQHRVTALFAHGINHMANRVPLLSPKVHSNRFSSGKLGGTPGGGTSYISLDSHGADVVGNTFDRESLQASRSVLINATGYTGASVIVVNNDMGNVDVSDRAYSITIPDDTRWIIGPNITPTGRITENYTENAITIPDDTVGLVTLPRGRFAALAIVHCQGNVSDVQNAQGGLARIDAGATPGITSVSAGANFNVSTATLTGTTGTDGNTTISPNAARQLQIENRSGSSRTYQVVFL